MIDGCQLRMIVCYSLDVLFPYMSVAGGGYGRFFLYNL